EALVHSAAPFARQGTDQPTKAGRCRVGWQRVDRFVGRLGLHAVYYSRAIVRMQTVAARRADAGRCAERRTLGCDRVCDLLDPLDISDRLMLQTIKQTWFFNVRGDLLSGPVVALAVIPEAIAFSIIAGVDRKVGLYASFCIAVVIAFAGGRPGMISAATGAMALLMATLVKNHGLEYLLAATLLCGVLQIMAGYLKLGSLMRF